MASSITRVCASPAGHLSGYFYSSMKRSRLALCIARVNGAITGSLDPYSYSHNFHIEKQFQNNRRSEEKEFQYQPISLISRINITENWHCLYAAAQ